MKTSTASEIIETIVTCLKNYGSFISDIIINDGHGHGEFKPNDSDVPVDFEFNVGYVREQTEVPSNWDPSYGIMDDGEVINDEGESIGYVKVIKRHPTKCVRLYDKDDITVSVGGNKKYKLNYDTASQIASVMSDSTNSKVQESDEAKHNEIKRRKFGSLFKS